jgi:hypothetical protein
MAIPGPASQSSAQDPLRITTFSPQSYAAMRNSQNASLPSPRTSTGIPGDVSKYNGKYNQGHLRDQDRKPSLPVRVKDHMDEAELIRELGKTISRITGEKLTFTNPYKSTTFSSHS